ncbi:MAG: 1-acyl-sn-glycerol-3-phosphate acyltransferase [Bacteroidales bacterium]|nr:1-acyl-sn-glycerol-3-phosphate acyltransferase [Bacteroidales bacterium]
MLLVTPGRDAAIDNIRKAAAEGRFNDKTEPFDPQWEREALKANILDYVEKLDSPSFKLKNLAARTIVDVWRRRWSDGINEIRGMEKLQVIDGPAFLTSNHFNPFDNGIHRRMALDAGRGRLWAVSEGTNFVMEGINGFVLRNIDVIPIINEPSYMNGKFQELMKRQLDHNRFILIYPEQEMWFNYRKPRPGKRGAFLFAAQFGVPVVPCFVEMQDLPAIVAPEFHDVKLILHILDPIFPDPSLNPRENSFRMCEQDYAQKKEAFQLAYGKPLDYDFTPWDIAGWVPTGR